MASGKRSRGTPSGGQRTVHVDDRGRYGHVAASARRCGSGRHGRHGGRGGVRLVLPEDGFLVREGFVAAAGFLVFVDDAA